MRLWNPSCSPGRSTRTPFSLTLGRVSLIGMLGLLAPTFANAQPITTRVSIGSGGTEANHISAGPALSADGRWVAFDSNANNLVPDDTNDTVDVFLHDRQTGRTTRVSVGPGGVQGDNGSYSPSISADGRFVAFNSVAGNLVVEDTNHVEDVFLYDRQTGITRKVSVGPGGAQGTMESDDGAISADGRWVTFDSLAWNLVADDTNAENDIFVHDLATGITTRVSLGPGGAEANGDSHWPAISADGRWVAFNSSASNLVPDDTNGVSDIFVHDRQTGITTRVNLGPEGIQANDWTFWWPAISGDGRFVAFQSYASNLVASDTNGHQDVFLHDRQTATTACVSVGPGAVFGDKWSEFPAISTDGRWVVFESPATNLVAQDSNGYADVFVYDIQTGTLTRASVGPAGVEGNMSSNLQGLVNGSTLALAWTNTYEGGAPTSFVLDVAGTINTSLSIGFGDSFTFANVPPGTYTLALRAENAAGASPPSNAVTLTFPGPCSGPPAIPTDIRTYREGSTVHVAWAPGIGGPAPTAYVLIVTGSASSSYITAARVLSGTVGPGTYALTVVAVNACGASAGTPAQTIAVP